MLRNKIREQLFKTWREGRAEKIRGETGRVWGVNM